MSELRERVFKLIDHLGISTSAFEVQIGMSPGSVNKMGDGTRRTTVRNIVKRYPQFSENWILFGEGQMLNPVVTEKIDIGDNKMGNNSSYQNNDPKSIKALVEEISAQRHLTEKVYADLSEAQKKIMEMADKIIDLMSKRNG